MGTIVKLKDYPDKQQTYKLIIYSNSKLLEDDSAVSFNKLLSEELVKHKAENRTMHLENCFLHILNSLPDCPTIKDIDVMFNPAYKIDVMKILISTFKQKPFKLIWPGDFNDGKLVYSEEPLSDYHTYSISDYDIICIV